MLMQIMVDYHTPMKQKGKKYLKCNKNKIKRINFMPMPWTPVLSRTLFYT